MVVNIYLMKFYENKKYLCFLLYFQSWICVWGDLFFFVVQDACQFDPTNDSVHLVRARVIARIRMCRLQIYILLYYTKHDEKGKLKDD